MKDYERLRKALIDLVEEAAGHADGCWGSVGLEISVKAAREALADIAETSEMERLIRIVKILEAEERTSSNALYGIGDEEGSRDCTMRANGMGKILDVIKSEFGHGGEDATDGS